MTDTMRERIARVISEGIAYNDRLCHYTYEECKDDLDAVVAFVLAAMREPDEKMIKSGVNHSYDVGMDLEPDGVVSFWQAMIDPAISEGKE